MDTLIKTLSKAILVRNLRSVIVIMAFFMLAPQSRSHASPPGKFKERVENDFMLLIPTTQAESVWSYLTDDFGKGVEVNGRHLDAKIDIDQFTDQYFDTRDRKLVAEGVGFRHRARVFASGAEKELIQIKLTPFGDHAAREELKFELEAPPPVVDTLLSRLPQRAATRELFSRVKGKEKAKFEADLVRLGVTSKTLQPFIRVKQERRRVYFSENGRRLFTVTLDFIKSRYFWVARDLVSLEVEIGENVFTGATEAQREAYYAIQEELAHRIQERFPDIRRDTNPKIVLLYRAMLEQGLVARLLLTNSQDVVLFFGVIGFFLIALFVVSWRQRRYSEIIADAC